MVTSPPVPKLVSSVPLLLYRASAMSKAARPAATIFPSGWTATDSAEALSKDGFGVEKGVVTFPPVPKPVSSVPLLL